MNDEYNLTAQEVYDIWVDKFLNMAGDMPIFENDERVGWFYWMNDREIMFICGEPGCCDNDWDKEGFVKLSGNFREIYE